MEKPDSDILFYEREFYMFSNFSSFSVVYKDTVWMTSEHAYQAAKFTDPVMKERIRAARSAHEALHLARAHTDLVRSDWQEVKLQIMEEVVRAKWSQHPIIQEKLRKTGTRRIVEDSPVDPFWGWGPQKDGANHLGNIWMKLREEQAGGEVAGGTVMG